jgi:hypothetical protein
MFNILFFKYFSYFINFTYKEAIYKIKNLLNYLNGLIHYNFKIK